MSLHEHFRTLRNPIGTQPIAWSNDDFHELGGDRSLETCLTEMHVAGYAGTELGHKFPKTVSELTATLSAHHLQLVSGWHSSYLATRPYAAEETDFLRHLDLLQGAGANTAIIAECSHRVYDDPNKPLEFERKQPALTTDERQRVYRGLDRFSELAGARGLRLVYHHHMGTVVQMADELDDLLASAPRLRLLFDTGHLSFAGIDPLPVLRKYLTRIAHVHLKNVRPPIVALARAERWSFARAVRSGVFTVPGDPEGGVDFPTVFSELASANYRGWFVVEAEQDPAKAPALRYARLARDYIRTQIGL